MDLDEFKSQVKKNLIQRVGVKEANKSMKIYEKDFPEFLKMNLTPMATATAIIIGYWI